MSVPAPSEESIRKDLCRVLTTTFGLRDEQIVPTARLLEDLDLDSLDWVDLVVRLEQETGLEITEDELGAIRTVQDVVGLIHRKLARTEPRSK
jgi:acyl carrier protein